MNQIKALIKKCLLVNALLILFNFCYAADPPDQGDPVSTPIDGGLSLVLAAGAGYLVKRRYDAKKKKAEKEKESDV